MHAVAAGSVAAVAPGPAGAALAVLLVALGAAAAWDRALLRGCRSPRAIEILGSGEALLVFADGKAAAARAVHGSGITRHWVALAAGSPMRRSLLVTSGMLQPGPFRLLRLWAVWGRVPGVAPGQLPA
ncbi:MAG TPA: hypothetical protein VKS43_08840 [Burkholderiales bacterium]|nr:hypothetical protein [Burkholderiales bacterium]